MEKILNNGHHTIVIIFAFSGHKKRINVNLRSSDHREKEKKFENECCGEICFGRQANNIVRGVILAMIYWVLCSSATTYIVPTLQRYTKCQLYTNFHDALVHKLLTQIQQLTNVNL